MIDQADVVQAYRWILGRSPESAAMISHHTRHRDVDCARFRFLNSTEFRQFFERYYLGRPFIWYIHIPKTAGTAIRNSFSTIFAERFYWHPTTDGLEDQSGSIFSAVRRQHDFFQFYDFCGGHLSRDLLPVGNAGRSIVYLAALRDPIERALSLYSFVRTNPGHDSYAEVRTRTLWEALKLEGYFYNHVCSEQLRYLSGFRDRNAVEKSLTESRYILFNKESIHSMFEHLRSTFGIPVPAVIPTNEGRPGYVKEIESQPQFTAAVELLRMINKDESDLLRQCQPVLDSANSL